jgi:hypothetical protein
LATKIILFKYIGSMKATKWSVIHLNVQTSDITVLGVFSNMRDAVQHMHKAVNDERYNNDNFIKKYYDNTHEISIYQVVGFYTSH